MIIEVVDVEIVQHCGLTITFSDGTYANYVAQELIDLRPERLQLQRAMRTPRLTIHLNSD